MPKFVIKMMKEDRYWDAIMEEWVEEENATWYMRSDSTPRELEEWVRKGKIYYSLSSHCVMAMVVNQDSYSDGSCPPLWIL